jgi:hypothetical protein
MQRAERKYALKQEVALLFKDMFNDFLVLFLVTRGQGLLISIKP